MVLIKHVNHILRLRLEYFSYTLKASCVFSKALVTRFFRLSSLFSS